LIGYTEESGSRVYRVYDEETQHVLVTRDVLFEEEASEKSPQFDPNQNLGIEEEEVPIDIQESQIDTPIREGILRIPEDPALLLEEENATIGDPLPPIDPDENGGLVNTYDEDTIGVRRPPIARKNNQPESQQAQHPSSRPPNHGD